MKRFITYLYEYEKGQKTKNTGFIRVDERNGRLVFQISVRNFIRSHEKGEIYAFVWENGLHGIELGTLTILNSQTDVRLELDSDNINETGYNLERVVGIGLVFPNNGYMASCWDDAYAETIGSGRFRKWGSDAGSRKVDFPQVLEEKALRKQNLEAGEAARSLENENIEQIQSPQNIKDWQGATEKSTDKEEVSLQAASYELVTYQKMELNAIKSLPSPNWYLCNNRFLVHGFFNYGYLILKKTTEADGEKTYLGVPGVYEKPEMVMATLFGFPEFQTLPKEVSAAKMEEIISINKEDKKSQEPKTGAFGCWLIPITPR